MIKRINFIIRPRRPGALVFRGMLAVIGLSLLPPIYSATSPARREPAGIPTASTESEASDVIPSPPGDPWRRFSERFREHFKGWATLIPLDHGVEIVLASDPLFHRGTAKISEPAASDVRELASWITFEKPDARIEIESHTDESPIVRHRHEFGSNWELSAARAGALATLFEKSQVPPARLSAVGLAASRPVGSEPEQNRRIVIRLAESGG